jgi:hypothetical protein
MPPKKILNLGKSGFILILSIPLVIIGCQPKGNSLITQNNKTPELKFEKELSIPKPNKDILENSIYFNRNVDSLSWNKIIEGKNRIVLFTSIYSCSNCLKQQFELIGNLEPNLKKTIVNNLIVIYTHPNYRDILTLSKMFKLTVNLYWLNGNNLGIDLEKTPGPFYFIYVPLSNTVEAVFTPEVDSQSKTVEYLMFTNSKFF